MTPLRLPGEGRQHLHQGAQESPETPPHGSGTVVKLSGKRKNPYQVRVNTRIDADGYPVYDVAGCFPDRVSAEIALAEYNKAPYDPNDRKKLFSEVFASWYHWK